MTPTLAQCVNLEAELERTNPPSQVRSALRTILSFVAGGCTPPSDLIQLVQSWLGRQHQQNRWGQ
jgi:hypothetical protein